MTIKQMDRDRLNKKLEADFPKGWAAGLIASAKFDTRGFENSGLLDCLVSGCGGWGSDPGGISFPDEIVEEEGGTQAQSDHVKFQVDAGPADDPYWIHRVPFEQAYQMFEVAAKHYVSANPDRRETVEAKMRAARKTFDRLIAQNEKWKKADKAT